MILEFQERIIVVEEWWSFAQKGDCVWEHILNTEVCISTQECKGSRRSGDKEHDRSIAGEEGYAAGCEGGERNGTRPFRSPCCTL